jgi:hypothetical protein
MLAGLLELLPWVKQWHNEPSDAYGGMRLGDFFEGFLDGECRTLGMTRDDLRAWRPEARPRRKDKPAPIKKPTPAELFAARPAMTNPYEEGLVVLSALIEFRGGKISRPDAAWALYLLFDPERLAARAPKAMRARVKAWRAGASARTLPPKLFLTVESRLIEASQISRRVEGEVGMLGKAADWLVQPRGWHLAEAELALEIAAASPRPVASDLAVLTDEEQKAVLGAA